MSLSIALLIVIAVFCSLLTVNAALLWNQIRFRRSVVTAEPVNSGGPRSVLERETLRFDGVFDELGFQVGQSIEVEKEGSKFNGHRGTIIGFPGGWILVEMDDQAAMALFSCDEACVLPRDGEGWPIWEPSGSNEHDERCGCPGCSGFCQDDYEFYSGTGQYAEGGQQ